MHHPTSKYSLLQNLQPTCKVANKSLARYAKTILEGPRQGCVQVAPQWFCWRYRDFIGATGLGHPVQDAWFRPDYIHPNKIFATRHLIKKNDMRLFEEIIPYCFMTTFYWTFYLSKCVIFGEYLQVKNCSHLLPTWTA